MERLVILKTFSSRAEAEIARGYLASRGLPAIVASDDAGGNLPQFDLTNGVNLLVEEHHLAQAKELLWEADAAQTAGTPPPGAL